MKKINLILVLVNTVVILAVLGLFVYTKMIFKHPAITESKERAKIEKTEVSTPSVDRGDRMLYPLDPVTVNLDSYTGADGKSRNHYISVTLSLEVKDSKFKSKIDDAKPVILDHVIQNLGRSKFEELNQVQGRYVFKSKIIDEANEYLKSPVITDVYLTDMLLQ
jgi:flagellar basal body-associated protein FliL